MERSEGLLTCYHTHYSFFGWWHSKPKLRTHSWIVQQCQWGTVVNELEFQTNKAIQYLIAGERNNNSLKEIIGKARKCKSIQDHITKRRGDMLTRCITTHWINDSTINYIIQTFCHSLDELLRSTILYAGIIGTTYHVVLVGALWTRGDWQGERCLLTTVNYKDGNLKKQHTTPRRKDGYSLLAKSLLKLIRLMNIILKHTGVPTHLKCSWPLILLIKTFHVLYKYSLNRIEKYMQDVKGNQSQETGNFHWEYSRFRQPYSVCRYFTYSNKVWDWISLDKVQKRFIPVHQSIRPNILLLLLILASLILSVYIQHSSCNQVMILPAWMRKP